MRFALTVLRLTLNEYTTYRLNFFLEILGTFVFLGVSLFVWLFLFDQQGAPIGGYSQNELVLYVLLAGLFASFLLSPGQGDEIDHDIRLGRLSLRLTQPLALLKFWFVQDLARKLTLGLMGIFCIIAIVVIFQVPLIWPTLAQLGWGILAFILGLALHSLIFMAAALLAFWLEYAWGFRFVLRTAVELAAGVFFPLSFFPPLLANALYVLPFQYLAAFPIEILTGRLPTDQIPVKFLIGLGWLAAVWLLLRWLWRKGVKTYTASGN